MKTSRDGSRVTLARPRAVDCAEYLRLARGSRSIHRPWVYPVETPVAFARYLKQLRSRGYEGFFVRLRETGELAGVIVLAEIVRGYFQNAYVGFYAMAPHNGRGYMDEGLRLVLKYAFATLKLHRLEANIQPGNERSIALVQRCGFRKEGYSPRYLKIGGRWRDHEHWSILAEDWRSRG